MKNCNNCGSQMPDEAVVCTVCGAPLAASQVPQQPYQQQAYQQPYQQTNVQPAGSGKATASLVLGIVSIVLGSLLFGIIGVVLGVQARNMMPEGTPGRGKATAGLVCSIIGCVWGSLILVCYVCAAMANSYYTALLGLL